MRNVVRGLSAMLLLLTLPALLLAQVSPDMMMNQLLQSAAPATGFSLVTHLLVPMLLAVVFTVLGLVLFAAALWIIAKVAPFSVRKEIEEDQNVALGIIVGAIIIGISIILAAAMIG